MKVERSFTLRASKLRANHIRKFPFGVMSPALSQFLSPTEMANLQQSYKKAPTASGSAASIIKTNHLEPFIETYLHLSCKDLSKTKQAKALKQLMSMVQDLSGLEHIELPSYRSIGQFFELIEARNLLRMSAQMHRTHRFVGLKNEQLQIAKDSTTTLQRAEKVRAWLGEHQAGLQAFVELDLRECNLTLLPSEIGQLGALTHLRLQNNRLASLPKEIGQLRALTQLWIDDNCLTSLPKEIGQLAALTTLNSGGNRLTSIPKEIGQLTALTHLWFYNNRLTSLPKEIGQLGALEALGLQNNRLRSLPKKIGQLRALILLELNNNRLTSLPKEIGRLGALIRLWIDDNLLDSLPKEIGQFVKDRADRGFQSFWA